MLSFGRRLKQLRKEKNMTQRQIAKIMGVDVASISRYENGRQTPSIKSLENLATFFNISRDWLSGKVNRITKEQLPDELAELYDYIEIIRDSDITDIPPSELVELIKIGKAMKKINVNELCDILNEIRNGEK